jgi:hypothetical protein
MLLNIVALRSWAGEHHYMALGWRALYSAFCKPVWGLCLAWIIISCYYGHGGRNLFCIMYINLHGGPKNRIVAIFTIFQVV